MDFRTIIILAKWLACHGLARLRIGQDWVCCNKQCSTHETIDIFKIDIKIFYIFSDNVTAFGTTSTKTAYNDVEVLLATTVTCLSLYHPSLSSISLIANGSDFTQSHVYLSFFWMDGRLIHYWLRCRLHYSRLLIMNASISSFLYFHLCSLFVFIWIELFYSGLSRYL